MVDRLNEKVGHTPDITVESLDNYIDKTSQMAAWYWLSLSYLKGRTSSDLVEEYRDRFINQIVSGAKSDNLDKQRCAKKALELLVSRFEDPIAAADMWKQILQESSSLSDQIKRVISTSESRAIEEIAKSPSRFVKVLEVANDFAIRMTRHEPSWEISKFSYGYDDKGNNTVVVEF